MKPVIRLVCFLSILTLISPLSLSGEVTIPNEFTAGDKAVASEVNENFNALKTAVNVNTVNIAKKISGKILGETSGAFQVDFPSDWSDFSEIDVIATGYKFTKGDSSHKMVGTVYIAVVANTTDDRFVFSVFDDEGNEFTRNPMEPGFSAWSSFDAVIDYLAIGKE